MLVAANYAPTPEQIALIKSQVAVGTTDDELSLFLHYARRTGLDPLAGQIHAIKRGQGADAKMKIQTSIDGFRLIAERTGNYRGQVGPFWCGEDGEWKDVWLTPNKAPAAAKVGILREGFNEPVWGVAVFREYAQSGQSGLTATWAKMPSVMIAKCAEALALRKAFPLELSGLYSSDEMDQADSVPMATAPAKAPAKVVDADKAEQTKWWTEKSGTPEGWSRLAGRSTKIHILVAEAREAGCTNPTEVLAYVEDGVVPGEVIDAVATDVVTDPPAPVEPEAPVDDSASSVPVDAKTDPFVEGGVLEILPPQVRELIAAIKGSGLTKEDILKIAATEQASTFAEVMLIAKREVEALAQ